MTTTTALPSATFDQLAQTVQSFYSVLLGRGTSFHLSPEQCEDFIQETYLRAHRDLRKGKIIPEQDLRHYVFRIFQNICIDAYRKRDSPSVVSLDGFSYSPAARTPTPLQTLMEDEALDKLLQRMQDIPQPMGRTLFLSTLVDLDPQTISATEQVPITTVRTRLFRARKSLLDKLPPLARAYRTRD